MKADNTKDPFDAAVSEWSYACTNGGQNLRPYGVKPEPVCNSGRPDASIAPVKSYPDCVSKLGPIYDLLGNVEEWEHVAARAGDSGVYYWSVRGSGAFTNNEDCYRSFGIDDDNGNKVASDHVGFRCCGD